MHTFSISQKRWHTLSLMSQPQTGGLSRQSRVCLFCTFLFEDEGTTLCITSFLQEPSLKVFTSILLCNMSQFLLVPLKLVLTKSFLLSHSAGDNVSTLDMWTLYSACSSKSIESKPEWLCLLWLAGDPWQSHLISLYFGLCLWEMKSETKVFSSIYTSILKILSAF